MSVKGFYTKDGKKRPITAKVKHYKSLEPRRYPHTKDRLKIVRCDPEKNEVEVNVEGQIREYELKRHPAPYATVAPDDPLKKKDPAPLQMPQLTLEEEKQKALAYKRWQEEQALKDQIRVQTSANLKRMQETTSAPRKPDPDEESVDVDEMREVVQQNKRIAETETSNSKTESEESTELARKYAQRMGPDFTYIKNGERWFIRPTYRSPNPEDRRQAYEANVQRGDWVKFDEKGCRNGEVAVVLTQKGVMELMRRI